MSNPTYIIDSTAWSKKRETQQYPNKAAILSYLKSFEPVATAGNWMVDVFTGDRVMLPEMATYVDGSWCWDSSDIYYFERYDAKLNPKFVKRFA